MTLFQRPCDDCSSFDFSCTGKCLQPKPFGVKLRIKSINVPSWWSNGHCIFLRRALDDDHPESIPNWIRTNIGIEPEDWMWK